MPNEPTSPSDTSVERPPTIVLFGATGYTGRLTARAMVEQGLSPVLAGRSEEKLRALAQELGGLSVRVADVGEQASVDALVEEGDVLVSTVGPFMRHGEAALRAAVGKGAHYLDSTGEPAFVARVFRDFGEEAQRSRGVLLPAFGYDYVPGNTAAASALERAGPDAVRVDVGYFVTGGGAFGMSQGTASSLAGAMSAPGVFFNAGRAREDLGGLRTRRFTLDGRKVGAISIPGSECLALPSLFPGLQDVNVYLGWFGNLSPLVSGAAHTQRLLQRVPGYARLVEGVTKRLGSKGGGPDDEARKRSGSHVVAIASDKDGRTLATAELRGVNGYTYTANMLAWGARNVAGGRVRKTGAQGPVGAFGLAALVQGNEEAGLQLTVA